MGNLEIIDILINVLTFPIASIAVFYLSKDYLQHNLYNHSIETLILFLYWFLYIILLINLKIHLFPSDNSSVEDLAMTNSLIFDLLLFVMNSAIIYFYKNRDGN